MSSLDAAQRRLEDALRRLEAATSQRRQGAGGFDVSTSEGAPGELGAEQGALFEDVNRLRDECGRLSEALDAAQRDNAVLRRINDEVARRLDGTIEQLQQLLEA